jgi:hypothetical protein
LNRGVPIHNKRELARSGILQLFLSYFYGFIAQSISQVMIRGGHYPDKGAEHPDEQDQHGDHDFDQGKTPVT